LFLEYTNKIFTAWTTQNKTVVTKNLDQIITEIIKKHFEFSTCFFFKFPFTALEKIFSLSLKQLKMLVSFYLDTSSCYVYALKTTENFVLHCKQKFSSALKNTVKYST